MRHITIRTLFAQLGLINLEHGLDTIRRCKIFVLFVALRECRQIWFWMWGVPVRSGYGHFSHRRGSVSILRRSRLLLRRGIPTQIVFSDSAIYLGGSDHSV